VTISSALSADPIQWQVLPEALLAVSGRTRVTGWDRVTVERSSGVHVQVSRRRPQKARHGGTRRGGTICGNDPCRGWFPIGPLQRTEMRIVIIIFLVSRASSSESSQGAKHQARTRLAGTTVAARTHVRYPQVAVRRLTRRHVKPIGGRVSRPSSSLHGPAPVPPSCMPPRTFTWLRQPRSSS
jgi:hypothetical protein